MIDYTDTNLIIGFCAIFLSMIYRFPQIYLIYKRKSGNDISWWMIFIQNLSYILYTYYGFAKNDIIYISSSIIAMIQNFIILGMTRYYNNSKNQTILITQNSSRDKAEVQGKAEVRSLPQN